MSPEQARASPSTNGPTSGRSGACFTRWWRAVPRLPVTRSPTRWLRFSARNRIVPCLPSPTPPGVRRLLRRCLEKDAKRRLRDIGDARVELDEAVTAPVDAPVLVAETRVKPHAAARTLGRPRGARRVRCGCGNLCTTDGALLEESARERTVHQTDRFRRPGRVNLAGRQVRGLSIEPRRTVRCLGHSGGNRGVQKSHGRSLSGLENDATRNVGFSEDASKVWVLVNNGKGFVDSWVVPTMGGTARPFLSCRARGVVSGREQACVSPRARRRSHLCCRTGREQRQTNLHRHSGISLPLSNVVS